MPNAARQFRAHTPTADRTPQAKERHSLYDLAVWRGHSRNGKRQGGLRQRVLIRDNYQCRECGVVVSGNEAHADHVTPHNGDRRLFLDINNIITLCERCHGRKTRGG